MARPEIEINPALTHYLAFGNRVFGRGETRKQAVNNTAVAGSRGDRKNYLLYRCTKDTTVTEMGDLEYPKGQTPILVDVVGLSEERREELLLRVHNRHRHQAAPVLAAAKCALADLEGIMPEYDASGDRQHPGWKTIEELKSAIRSYEEDR